MFIYLFIYTFSLTHLQVRPVDGFSSLMAQTTRTRARMCILGVSLILLLIFGGEIPKTQFFGLGMNRRFQAKRAIYWKFHFIKTTASILTKSKFGLTIETTKGSSWVVRIGAQQIQDGGRPPYWKKTLNRHISATVRPILMKFGMLTHIGPWQRINRYNVEFLKIQDGSGRHLEKSQKSRYLHNGLTDFYETWYRGAKCISQPLRPLRNWI